MLNHLESLCRLCGASGQEHPVRDYLIEQIKPLGDPSQKMDDWGTHGRSWLDCHLYQ